jgi:hypothetical protein
MPKIKSKANVKDSPQQNVDELVSSGSFKKVGFSPYAILNDKSSGPED